MKTSYEDVGIYDYGNNPITDGGVGNLTVSMAQPTASMSLPDESQVLPILVRRSMTFLPAIPLLIQD